jgi:hypothetical protein
MDWVLGHGLTAFELFFAGTWASIWHKGILYGALVVVLALAFGSQFLAVIPVVGPALADLFKPLRKDLLWAAFAIGLVLGGEYVGASDARKECVAKTVVIEKVVDKAVTKSSTPHAKAAKDPYDSEDN